MYLEIEIDHNRGSNTKFVTLRLEEDSDHVKMKFDRRPDFDIPDFRMLRKKRIRAQRKSDGSASFLRAARAGNLEKVLEFLKTNTDINTSNANGLNALHLASKEGHVHVVTELLQRGASVDAATKKGNTALHIASLAGQEEIVKVLVQHQALVNIQSQNGFTPLYMAAQENHDNVVRFLLANNANQSIATEDGFTPLAVALQQGHDKVVAVLLENDTRGKVRLPALHIAAKKDDTKAAALLLHTDHNPDVTSKSGFTPLHIAAHYGNENIANLLIQRGADVNYIAKHQITPLHVASKWGKGNMVSLLIDKGANYEAKTRDGLTPLHCAARSGHETVVDMLLEKGAPITSKTKNGLAPLHMASQGDHVDAARILLYHKAPVDDVTVDFLTALHVAAHCGHVRVAKLLLDRKADPNSRALNGFTPLHIACKKNRIKVVELLLKHGASIEATTESGLTPLHVASFMGCMNIVIYLIQHGASADVPTVRGETPLHLAARANQTDIIRILLRNGAQVDARAREQQTALHIASRLGNSDIVVLLLQHGAAVDATTKDHYTALHIAAKEGQEEVASVLLEHGASLTSTTKKGFTPLHLAAKYGNMKVARLLLQKDAPVDSQGKNGVTPLHVAAHYDHQNVALLLLDKGASPHATAKNGYTPLHIAARKNQMDIATTLLEYGAHANAESKAGFTPLHLSSQEGHTDMATLLIEHSASPGSCAKNGLTPLHLCAQEDRVNVAAILVKHGAQIDPVTKAGYTPLHVASHFGQMNMVRFLLQHGGKVDSTTQLGYTPLHQAAQQGHTQIVNLLLENKAEPNAETNDGKTALSIAQRLGYISVVETLKIVTETTITTTTTTVTEEKYKVVVPETMHETFMSESEDEGGDDNLVSTMFGKPQHVTLPYYEGQLRYTSDDTMLGDQSYRYLTVDEMKSLGDDSLPIDVTKDEKMDVSFISNSMAAPPVAPADQLSPQHHKEQQYAQLTATYPSDNVDIAKTPILAGVSLNSLASCLSAGTNTSGMWRDRFLVSFMVDARGGAMRGCRHSGVRVIIPPRKAAMPMRITCRYLKKDKLVHAPPLMEGEALASRILEMGPAGAKFLGPVIIEVPHFASLRGKEREIVILRSDNGETWREHTLEATEEAVQEVLNESFDGEELKQLEDLNTNRITRILTTDFPQYFAIVTRIRQEVHAIGPEGGMVSSTVVPQVQAVFPQGALTKKIKVGLQAQPIPTDLVAKLLGNRVAVSPIVTVEPRRRKFHKPITLTIPVPQASSKGMINQYSGEAPTLRLLCSITGGTTRAQWEDVTGSTPLTFVNDCVSFTTTVSARFWLMDCSNIPEATKMATELYREAIHVPFMAKFVVFSKRHQLEEARVRVFCMTDDREDKTLENQEMFVEVAKSRDVEVLEGKPQFLEFAGNLVPVTKSGDQLAFNFYAFRENRLPFTVRVKDQHADCIGRVIFMRQPKVGRGDPPQTPICNLNIALPDNIQPEPAPSEPDLLALEKKYSFLSISKADTIHKADLRLTDISNMLGTDWVGLARELEISDSDINIIKSQYPDNAPQQAIVMLRLWMQTSGNKANGNTLEKGLRKIGRDDIVNQCIFNVELVTDDIERAMAKAHLDQPGFEAFREELGPSRDATLNRDISLDVSYDEQDMMKEAESAEEEEENQRTYQDKTSREQRAADLSPTYETEEKKYAGEEKVVAEEKVIKEEVKDGSTVIATTTTKIVVQEPDIASDKESVITEKVQKEVIVDKTPTSVVTIEKVEEKKASKVEEQVVEEKLEEKPIIDIEKHVEVVDKFQESLIKSEEKVPVVPIPSQMPEDSKVKETTTTETTDGTTTSSTTTTERRSFTTSDDGTVQEHIVIEKRTTSAVDGVTAEEDKSDILQRLGEELGRLDEKLEEKFKEKRKTEEPEEGFTQTSVEKSQMSSTRGTADVSTAGTTVTTVQHVGDSVMQTGQALIQQMAPQAVDRRIAQQQQNALAHQGQTTPQRHPRQEQHQVCTTPAATTDDEDDDSKNGRTEERGCSPITVLEGRVAEGDHSPIRPLSRSGAHTITTTTSWGAPVSTTTSIQLDDSENENFVQLTLHSESHVTLHAPGEVWQELKKAKQQEQQQTSPSKGLVADGMYKLEKHPDTLDSLETSVLSISASGSNESIYKKEHYATTKELQSTIQDSSSAEDIHNRVTRTQTPSEDVPDREIFEDLGESNDEQIPSNVAYKNQTKYSSRNVCDNITDDSFSVDRYKKESSPKPKSKVSGNRNVTPSSETSIKSSKETEIVSVDEVPQQSSTVDIVMTHESVEETATDSSVSVDSKDIQVTQASLEAGLKAVCDNSVVLSEDNVYAASEVLAPSAHRPTTLMITSNSNESTDDAECMTNDPTKISGENDLSQDRRQETRNEGMERQGIGIGSTATVTEYPPCSEGGAVPRPERPSRPAPRTTTLVKVKVEKRPVGSHSQVRERSGHDHSSIVHAPSVEEEVRGLMREVKEATSQIKQEVKELRQADTPTPDTPTPLREFREFLNREEEQEQERLPTIKEMCRESEEDASVNTGGEGLRGNEHLRLDLDSPVLERTSPVQFVHHGFDESVHPDSGYSTLEGYYAVGTDPSIATKYIPSYNEPVPEGSSSEPSIKSELESPSSLVDSSDLSPVDSVCSATSPGIEKQGKSKFKSFMKRVRQLTSKGNYKPENRGDDSQGEETSAKDMSGEFSRYEGLIEGSLGSRVKGKVIKREQFAHYSGSGRSQLGSNIKDLDFKMSEDVEKCGTEGNIKFSESISGDSGEKSLSSISTSTVIIPEDENKIFDLTQNKYTFSQSPLDVKNITDQRAIVQKSVLSGGEYVVECTDADEHMQVMDSPGSESLIIGSPLPESPFSESSASGSQFTESLMTEPSMSDHSPEGVAAAFEMDSEHKKLEVDPSGFDLKSGKGHLNESKVRGAIKPDYNEFNAKKISPSTVNITLPRESLPEIGKLTKSSSQLYGEGDDDLELSHKEAGKILETLIEVDETEDTDDLYQGKVTLADFDMPYDVTVRPIERDSDILDMERSELDEIQLLSEEDIKAISTPQIMLKSWKDEVHWSSDIEVHKVDDNIIFAEELPDTRGLILTEQNLEMGTETTYQFCDAESLEDLHEVKEITIPSPDSVTVAVSVHQAEYPQIINFSHKIVGTPFSHNFEVRRSSHDQYAATADTESMFSDIDVVDITETVFQVSQMQLQDDVATTEEMVFPDVNTERGYTVIHHGQELEDFAGVVVQERSVCSQFEVQKAVQAQKLKEIEMDKAEDMALPEVIFEKSKAVIHEYQEPKDFTAITVSKETIYPPYSIENAVNVQEMVEEIGECENMCFPNISIEKGLSTIHDPKDFAVAIISKTSVCHQHDTLNAVQVQEVEEDMGESESMTIPGINFENCITTVHEDDMGIATVNKAAVFQKHEIERAVQIQEIREVMRETENLSLPDYKLEKVFATIHDDQNAQDFGEAAVSQANVASRHEIQKAVQVQEIEEEIGKSESITIPEIRFETGTITAHEGHDAKDFGMAVVCQSNISHLYDIQKAAQIQKLKENISRSESMSLPVVIVEKGLETIHEGYDPDEFGKGLLSKANVSHVHDIEKVVQVQEIEEEMRESESLSLPDVCIRKGKLTVHRDLDSKDFGVAVKSKSNVSHLHDIKKAVQVQEIREKMGKAKGMSIPDVKKEKGYKTVHHVPDFNVAVKSKVNVSHMHDIKKAVQIQEIRESLNKSEGMSFPDIDIREGFTTVHASDSNDFGVAVSRKTPVSNWYDIERAAQMQEEEREIYKIEEMHSPDVHVEESFVTVHQDSDFNAAVVWKDTVCHNYEVERVAQPQVVETGETEELFIPYVSSKVSFATTHQVDPSDFDVAIVNKDTVLHHHDVYRIAHIQEDEKATGKTEEMPAVGFDLVEGYTSIHQDEKSDFNLSVIRSNLSCYLYDTERATRPQVVEEVMYETDEMFIPNVDVKEALPTIHQGNELVNFDVAITVTETICHQDVQRAVQPLEDKTEETICHAYDTQRAAQTHELQELSITKELQIGKGLTDVHQSEKTIVPSYAAETHQVLEADKEVIIESDFKSDYDMCEKSLTIEPKEVCEGEIGVASSTDFLGIAAVQEFKNTLPGDKIYPNVLTKKSSKVTTKDRSSEQGLSETCMEWGVTDLNGSSQVEERPLVTKDFKPEFYEAEQELAKIIHKQMEELNKDDEGAREKQAVASGFSEKCEREGAMSVLDSNMSEGLKAPNKQCKSGITEFSDDMEKIYVLDRVSDELRNMISSLEYNLAAGISRNIKITPILARLEQLEQEVANITKSSEATESSIPMLSNIIETDDVVSFPQTIPLSVRGAEASHGEKIQLEDTAYLTKMPVVLGNEAATLNLPTGPSPTGETNGVDLPDALTDVEDLWSDGDQSPLVKRKAGLNIPQQDLGAITDTEDMDLSGDENEFIQEKTNLPTIQDLGLLPEPTKETINLTEGFVRQASPLLLSDSEGDAEDVEGRHKKNIKRMESLTELQVPEDTFAEGLTDVEDMVTSGDEVEEAAEALEDSLPEHYMDQSEGVSDKEKLRVVPPTPKIFLTRGGESSDEEKCHKQKPKRKSKGGLKVEVKEEGTTDVEDLVFSDKGDDTAKSVSAKVEVQVKPKKKKQVRRKIMPKPAVSKKLTAPSGDADGLTDVEILTGDDEEDAYDDEESYLPLPEYGDGVLTDTEDVEASDTENLDDLLPEPIEKLEPTVFPEPHAEKVKISETEEQAQPESGADTDEEGFVMDDKDDQRPLMPRKKVTHEPLETIERFSLDIEDPCETVLTDTEDFDIEDKEEEEIIEDFVSRIPKEGESYTLKEMESHMGSISKKEMLRDVHAELKKQIKEAELAGLTLQEALNDDTLTDVEDLDEDKTKPKPSRRKKHHDDQTDEESVNESDIEEEVSKPAKKGKRRGKRLPLAPQISEVRFIETEQGPLSIIITPDTLENNPSQVIKDRVANVVFLEKDENECTTDVEDLDDDDAGGRKVELKTPASSQEPTTDTEDLDIDPSELERPLSPMPPNVMQSVFSSPKREMIHIKEDKYGVPQVTIRKLGKDELLVSDFEDEGVTDTEDIEVSEGEALRLIGVTEDSTSDFELPDSGKIEVSTKMSQKEGLQVELDEDGGSTDVEELTMPKKSSRKQKSQSKLAPQVQEESLTDVELLSDQDDKSTLKIRVESPNAHTDMEDFETSEGEELEIPTRHNAATPDIITRAAVKKIVILKEGPDGVVQTEEAELAPARKGLLQVEDESEGVTDVEDMEASGAEDEDSIPVYPPVELPCGEPSSVEISEKSRIPKANNEAKLIKDNLLLPEDNYNNLTDVESLSEGEGNRCASNTELLSSQQLTYAVESRIVEELPYYLPPTDPKLCVNPGLSLESDPFCGELTSPLVVEAELEQVYYHAPKEDAQESEVELEASDGCVVRKRQVVASLCHAREIRRFWSLDRDSPLHQSEISAFATPTIHKKGFKTILYLEQPNLLDTISISDTLCDSGYLRNERLLDFDSSSIDSFDDHFSYRDSDIVTVVDRFNQERGSSFDDLPSPHLSSIGSTGLVDSVSSGRSFASDPHCYGSNDEIPTVPRSSYSMCSSDDTRKESDLTLSVSGASGFSFSPDTSIHQDLELSSLEADTPVIKETKEFLVSSSPYDIDTESNAKNRNVLKREIIDDCISVVAHPVSKIIKGPAVERHEGFTTECIRGYASKHHDASTAQCTETDTLENSKDFTTEHIKGYAPECVELPALESLENLSSDYVEIDSTSCIKNSPTAYVQRSITEWVVGRSNGNFEGHGKVQAPNIHKEPIKTCSQISTSQYADTAISRSSSDLTAESLPQTTIFWLKTPHGNLLNQYSQTIRKAPNSNIHYASEVRPSSLSYPDSVSSRLLLSSEYSTLPFEDSGVHEYQTSGHFLSSFDANDRFSRSGYDSDRVSLADSVLGLEDQSDRELLEAVRDKSITYISAKYSPTSSVKTHSPVPDEEVTRYPEADVPLSWHHTLPRTYSQLKSSEQASSIISGNVVKDFEEISKSKDFGGVKGLIDQWEVIVREEKLRSLPTSPAVGRKILPPCDGNKRSSWVNLEGEAKSIVETDSSKQSVSSYSGQEKCDDVDSFDGGSVIEEVASVCDIIQQFEGRVGRLGKMNAHRQRLPRGSQSPASRSPSHPRRVATVKPLCEPQLQQEKSLLQEEQMQQHQDHIQDLMEHTVSAGFVPRVVESLSITKSSSEIWEENLPQASVSNPEGTHEAAQVAEQQPTTFSHDQGLDVEEMSNIMESYTSDGGDLITTTYTTTSTDPDPITSTQTTRIIRRTEIEDGEVKEEVYEEY